MRTSARVLVSALLMLGLALATATVTFTLLDPGGSALGAFFLALPGVAFTAVGGLLAQRRPENGIGRLCLAIGMLWLAVGTSDAIATWAAHHDKLQVAAWAGCLGALWVPALGLMATHLPLRLPNGVLLSPRWRSFSRFCTVVIVVLAVAVTTEPGRVADVPGTENPLGWEAPDVLAPLFVLFPLSLVVAVASLVLRYRRSDGLERQQIRVIALGAAIFVVVYLFLLIQQVAFAGGDERLEEALGSLTLVAYTAIPVAIGVAVFRYRLYDIDIVINRTLVYGALTATLALAYFSGVLLLQLALSPLTERSDLAVAGATLAVAALFRPARSRIQGLVDLRFYRNRYDAARTLEAFSGRLREQLDLEALSADLCGAVQATVQPTHVSLWLREVRR